VKIELLGATGCAKCKELYERVIKVVEETQSTAVVTKVEDIMKIMDYGVMTTPAVVIDGTVVMQGGIPKETEIKAWLAESGKTDLKAFTEQLHNDLASKSDVKTASKCCYCNP